MFPAERSPRANRVCVINVQNGNFCRHAKSGFDLIEVLPLFYGAADPGSGPAPSNEPDDRGRAGQDDAEC